MSVAININSLTKRYNNTDIIAVDNISMAINMGEVFGILGPNGAGKTTTISILCSLLQPTSGSVEIMGKSLHTNLQEIRSSIGVVPQDIALYPNLTAMENLNFFGRMYGIENRILRERSKDLLDIFGLTENANQRISTFSGGMKRRLNLITGILHMPKILFLDEPTVGIDVQSRAVIMEYLMKLMNNEMTIVYTSHHMEEAEKYCTRVAIIDRGKIIENGAPVELIQKYRDCNKLEDIFLEITGRSLRD